MKRRTALALIFAVVASALWAQVVHDPNDELYADLDRWAARGYLSMLPPVRPYPAQLLDELLKSVARSGDASSRTKAEAYLSAIAPGARPVHVGATGTIRGIDGDISLEGAPTVDGMLRPEDYLSASFALSVYGSTRTVGKEITVPGLDSPFNDLVPDNAKVGPFYILQNWTSAMAVGNASLYFQAGLNRTSFGPFFDNGVVVGPQAGRAGHFSLVYRKPAYTFSVLLLEISATDTLGAGMYPNKHLILHSIDFTPFPGLELGFYESVVWGGRFEFMYMAPFNQYFAAQSLSGFEDNSLFGIHGRWSAADRLQVLGDVYVDDLNFNDMLKLNLNTKYKFASQLGLRWIPANDILKDFALDYTAVMPYMYTHIAGDRDDRYRSGNINYFNYTHRGAVLGADLQPNSDRLSLRAKLSLFRGLDLSLSAALSRHGNASEGEDNSNELAFNEDYLDDGSVNDDGFSLNDQGEPKNTYNTETRFLTQKVIETKAAAGVGVSFTLPTSFGSFTAKVDYVMEYGWNRDLEKGKDGLAHYYAVGGVWRW